MQTELNVKSYYIVDKTGYWITGKDDEDLNTRTIFRTYEEANRYLENIEIPTVYPNGPFSIASVEINQTLDPNTPTETVELIITSKILEDSLKRMKANYDNISKEYLPPKDFKILVKNFENYINYDKLTNSDPASLKEVVIETVELILQQYYNKFNKDHFSKLQPKEDNNSFNIYKAFEDKKKRIEDAQNVKPFKYEIKEGDKKEEDNSSFDIYSVLKRVLKGDNTPSVSSINQYFVTYFKLYTIIKSGRIDAYHYDRYRQAKLQFETVSNILAGYAPTMAEHFHNLEVLESFAKRIIDIVHLAICRPQLNKPTTDSFKQWIINLTDAEFEHYFGAHVDYNEKEFTLSSPVVNCHASEPSQCYWRCFTNINNTLTWREK